jgi:hypothetical protein
MYSGRVEGYIKVAFLVEEIISSTRIFVQVFFLFFFCRYTFSLMEATKKTKVTLTHIHTRFVSVLLVGVFVDFDPVDESCFPG